MEPVRRLLLFESAAGPELQEVRVAGWKAPSRACPKKQTAGPPTPVPSNIWGSFQRVAQPENANAAEQPWRATRGSAELNLCSTARLILTPRMGVQLVESDFKGPLPPNTVGLLLGLWEGRPEKETTFGM